MTNISQDRLKKKQERNKQKQERKKQKERRKRWKRINQKIDTVLAILIIAAVAGITVLDAYRQLKEKES